MGKSLVSCFLTHGVHYVYMRKHYAKIEHAVAEMCSQTDRQTDRHTDKQTRSSQYSVPGFFLVRRVHPDH